ncbi:MAG: nucleotidyltransferase domain-containing protein [Acetobacteraceae bacterium]|nr:nucleotidyltransferase domain-containing protein [Pseudomonadota bacterium]
MQIVTLTERKAAEADRKRHAVEELRAVLTEYARTHGGRFLLFGSAARNTMRFDSDVDILVDFPDDTERAAWGFAEWACWDRKLEPDIMPFGWCKPKFLAHIEPDLQVLA